MQIIAFISHLLKQRQEVIQRMLNRESSRIELMMMFLLSIVLYAAFGVLIGASHSLMQAISSAVKLPLLFFVTTLICFPTLYFFLSFLGVKQSSGQLFSFIILCNTFISLVLAAFAPVSFFFLITGASYHLFKVINTLIFSVAGLTGIYIFYREIKILISELATEQKPLKTRKGFIFLRLWAVMFAFIGLQLSFTLSPYFGIPGQEFIFFTNEKTNFFSDILDTITHIHR
jgi:uncharacterized membrane protein